ncbi:DegT/DnrJ/EryC1/StrS family aminotransferase [uncultured Algimonas sp.]|uniref:DegT/DnrJ/EryC1/StrS family aminotransferase n=1 Tax=uncultured Algimonas sp. TaxID=1547920 RepID=UPI0026385D9B|nr:DegT/DnrJ/EryC1/StrS family aminotransferase [uncultured Algimonas sp.]
MAELPFIPLAVPNITQAEGDNLQECIRTTYVSTVGAFVGELEEGVAKLSGTKHAVAMGAGTMALHMSLHALDIGRGDLVILPSFTFIASANSIAHAGARPWLFDIEADSWTLDAAKVRAGLDAKVERRGEDWFHVDTGERLAAIMPVYTLGTPADMDAINAIARDYGIPVIADAAAAIGVDYKGRPIGQCADLTCYSFNGNKTITSGGGGMVVGDDDALLTRIKHVSTTARVSTDYDHDEVGYNYRMTNLEAAVGCAQLERLPKFLSAKRRIRATYDEKLAGLPGVSPFPYPNDRQSTCWFSGIVVDEAIQPSASEICDALMNRRIQARTFWKPVHLQKPFADVPCEDQSVGEGVWGRIVTLPCSTQLTAGEQNRVIETLKEILRV